MYALFISEKFTYPKVYQIEARGLFIDTNQNILRFNVSMQDILFMNIFNDRKHLISDIQNTLHGEYLDGIQIVSQILSQHLYNYDWGIINLTGP